MSLLDEERFPLRQKARLGINRSRGTLVCWIRKGLFIRKDGRKTKQRVKLEAVYEGEQLVTSREAVKRFLARLNGITIT